MSTLSVLPPCCWQIVEAVTSFRSSRRSELLNLGVHARSSSNEAQGYLTHCMDSVQDIANLVGRSILLNRRQCQDLSSKVLQTAENVQKLVLHFRADSCFKFQPALENLYRVLENARLLINDCSKADWCQASVFQMQNEEAFSEILMEIGLCYNVIYEQARGLVGPDGHVEVEDLRKSSTFYPASESEVLEDEETLRTRLEEQLARSVLSTNQTRRKYWILGSSCSSNDQCLAKYLLGKLKLMSEERMNEGLGMSNTLSWPMEMESQVKINRFLGQGAFGAVLGIEWLGMPSAMKIFELDGICDILSAFDIFRKEAEILACLNHPHIVKFFCCGHDTIKRQYFIGMELMEMNLYHFIQERREEGKSLAYDVALHIIIQIARGMCYLHDQGIAHRDLKPHNVVISNVPLNLHLVYNFLVKLVDLGLSKTRLRFSKSNTISKSYIGTTKYRAPEAFLEACADVPPECRTRVNWFKADVYSFAVTCSELLTLKEPFQDLPLDGRRNLLSSGWRPKLPSECPQALVALLEQCWDTNPQLRPSFRQICITLEKCQYDLVTTSPVTADEGYTYVDTLLTHHSHLRRQRIATCSSAAGGKIKAMLKSMHCIEDTVSLVGRGNLLYGSQCQDLSSKLCKTVNNVEAIISHPGAASIHPHFLPALENLYRILKKSRLLVSDCSRKDWCRASMLQIQNEEAFREILVETGLCYHVIYEQAREIFELEDGHLQIEDLRQMSTFEPADESKVLGDRETLLRRLEKHVRGNNDQRVTGFFSGGSELSNDESLAGYLLAKLKLISEDRNYGDLDISNAILWAKETDTQLVINGVLGQGAFGTVLSTRWLGMPCAMKFLKVEVYPDLSTFQKEAEILGSLNHPNVVKFFCCGHDSQKKQYYIGMEVMEMDLYRLIQERREKGKPFPNHVALDIIMQIARGMCYVHDRRIAHRDLKPQNILIRPEVHSTPYLEDEFCVKLADFGMSKREVMFQSEPAIGFGTTRYRAPEIFPEGQGFEVKWFRPDVYSFAVTCSQILTLEDPFSDIPRSLLYQKLLSGARPNLPLDCPPELVALIHNCWDINPDSRPSFRQICTRLEMYKHDLLRRPFTANEGLQLERADYPDSHKYIEAILSGHSQRRIRQHVGTVASSDDNVEAPLPSESDMGVHIEELNTHNEQSQQQPRPRVDASTSEKPESSTSHVEQSITLQFSMSFHVSVVSVAGNMDISVDVQKACEAFFQRLNRSEDQTMDFRIQAVQSIVAYLREAHPKHNVLVVHPEQDCAHSHIELRMPGFFGMVPIKFDVYIFSRGSVTLVDDDNDTIWALDGPSFHQDGKEIKFSSS